MMSSNLAFDLLHIQRVQSPNTGHAHVTVLYYDKNFSMIEGKFQEYPIDQCL